MNERLRFIVAGFFVGLAEILPGISGSTIAIAIAMVEPDIPGRISASPTKNPATINLNLSFITQNHQKIYLEAWEQKTHPQNFPQVFHLQKSW